LNSSEGDERNSGSDLGPAVSSQSGESKSSEPVDKTLVSVGATSQFSTQAPISKSEAIPGIESDNPEEAVGSVLGSKYEIGAFLGAGGMSTVYKAKHLLTGKIVAIKLMHGKLLNDATSLRRFQQEAKAASRLDHPNAITIYDMGVAGEQPYLVMDYLDGEPLSALIKEVGKLEPKRALHIYIQACDALATAHKLGIIHRDLKPSNIMLVVHDGAPDFVKLVDFGIAKITAQEGDAQKLTTTGEVFGSPLYMSPEQASGKNLDVRSDIYSMGCLMYEGLMGHAPLQGDNVIMTLFKQVSEMPPPLRGLDADIRLTNWLNQILMKCLEKDPAKRYQTVDELRKDLHLVETRQIRGLKLTARMKLGFSSLASAYLTLYRKSKVAAVSVALFVVLALAFVATIFSPTYGISADPSPSRRQIALIAPDFLPDSLKTSESALNEGRRMDGANIMANYARFGTHLENKYNSYKIAKEAGDFQKWYRNDYVKAAEFYHHAYDRLDELHLANSNDAISIWANLLECALFRGSYEEAVGAANSGLTAIMNQSGKDDFSELMPAGSKSVYDFDPRIVRLCAMRGTAELAVDNLKDAESDFLNVSVAFKAKQETVMQHDLPESVAYSLASTGLFYSRHTNDRQTARMLLEASEHAFSLLREVKRYQFMASYNMGVVKNALARMDYAEKNYDKATQEFKDADDLFAVTSELNPSNQAKVLFNLADLYWKRGEYWNALQTRATAKNIWRTTQTKDNN
jgi:serine/threonine protein kinase